MAEEDWDLYAIVRSCSSATNTSTTATSSSIPNTITENVNTNNNLGLTFGDHEEDPFSFPNFFQSRKNISVFQELHDSYRPFLPSATITTPFRNFGGFRSAQNQYQSQLLQLPAALQNQLQATHGSGIVTSPVATPRSSQSQTPKSRKKKNTQKRTVVRLTAENLADDVWAWRKYGQKPIKGSPYPRNYYRCSSSKGCVARKQVERCNKDPNTFIVSYTGEHTHPRPTHRNSLAGSTRNKFQASQKPENNKEANNSAATATTTTACSSSRVPSTTSISPTIPLSSTVIDNQTVKTGTKETCQAMESDEDDDILIPNNIALNEDLIKELHELGTGGGGSSSGSFGLADQSPDFDDNF